LNYVDTHQNIINKKWIIQILIILSNKKKLGYGKLQRLLLIPTSTLTIRLNELVKNDIIEKFVYGNPRGPHYTEYKITDIGMVSIYTIIDKFKY